MLCLSFVPLLALVLGAAFSQDTPKKRCTLSKYGFPVPHELQAVWKMKKEFEAIVTSSGFKCNTTLFHQKWETAELSVEDRLTLVKAELDLAVTVLEGLANPTSAETHQQPLAFLTQAQKDVQDCMENNSSPEPSGKLKRWLHKLEMAKNSETNGLKACTIFHLFQFLYDLKCAALQKQCTTKAVVSCMALTGPKGCPKTHPKDGEK
ncbi:interferon lambda-1 [Cariama cristata]